MSAIINQVANGIGGIATSISSAFDMIVYELGKFVRRFMHYIKVAFEYIYRYLKLASSYVQILYNNFMKDPIGVLQFTGSLLILVNGGAL
ncbi:MAG: hypothetical protein QXT48_02105 [Thermoplasmatales archaeon]|uniref:hypothetical protein n=1 Tax=Thermofilum sp. TaxID=1961369 RepID=UPI00316BD408